MEAVLNQLHQNVLNTSCDFESVRAYGEGLEELALALAENGDRVAAVRFNLLLCEQLVTPLQAGDDSDGCLLDQVLLDALSAAWTCACVAEDAQADFASLLTAAADLCTARELLLAIKSLLDRQSAG